MQILARPGRRAFAAVAGVSMLLAAGAASAHHGWGSYDADRPVTVSGPITEVAFEQPHVHVKVNADGKSWLVVLAPPSRMESRGATEGVLAVGATISAYGFPNRDDPNEIRAERITIDGHTYEMR
jgi:hypothetical protein